MRHIAFDLGGSGGKVGLGNFTGDTLAVEIVHRFPNRQMDVLGNLYWNALGIYAHLQEGIAKAVRAHSDVRSVGIDSFCNDFAFVDNRGALLSQVYCYRDGRSERWQENIYEQISKRSLHFFTGNQNALFNTVMQLGSLKMENKGYFFHPDNTLLLLPDLLGFFLTGERRTEYCNASVTQLFDMATGDWQPDILAALEIPKTIFAPIIQPGNRLGPLLPELQRSLCAPGLEVVAVCSHDTASAVAALPTNRQNVAFISSGTWSLLGTELASPIVNDRTLALNFAVEGCAEGRCRLLKNIMGLWLVEEVRHSLSQEGMDYDYGEMVALAESVPPFRSLIDPDDHRFYSPGGMPEKIAALCAQTSQPVPESPGQLIRCILESLAMKYRWALDEIEGITGHALGEIHILGGGGQNRLLNQFTANACNRPAYAGLTQATLCGNLLMQLRAYGEISNLAEGREVLARSVPLELYEPGNTALWQEQYQRWLHLFPHYATQYDSATAE